ncbi:MAG: DNA polymerase III subunit [Parcubacteria group bacterium]
MGKETKAKTWDVIGHQPVVEALQRHLEMGKVNHAYLFVGPQSVGKRKVATEFAKALYCQGEIKPCGECKDCLDIETGKQIDVTLTSKEKGKIGIDQIREIQHRLALKSYTGGYKVCIIDGADCFTLSAANAILKILEEPAEKVVFILLAENIESIIPTVISRSVIFNFNLVAKSKIAEGLADENDPSVLAEIAQAAFGRPGLAIKYLNNSDELPRQQERQQELLQILNKDLNQSFQLISSWKVKNEQAREFISVMTEYFRDLAVNKVQCSELALMEKDTANTNRFSGCQIKDILSYLVKANSLLSQNVNPKLIIENFIVMLHHDQV